MKFYEFVLSEGKRLFNETGMKNSGVALCNCILVFIVSRNFSTLGW